MTSTTIRPKRWLLLSVVALNLVALAFLTRHMFAISRQVQEQALTGLAWGDPAPEIDELETLSGDTVPIVPSNPDGTTFLTFMDAEKIAYVEGVLEQVQLANLPPDSLHLILVYTGTAESWRFAEPQIPRNVAVVPDPDGAVRDAFAIPPENAGSFTIAVDHEARIRVHVGSILPAPLLVDFVQRRESSESEEMAIDEPRSPARDSMEPPASTPLASPLVNLPDKLVNPPDKKVVEDTPATGTRLVRMERIAERGGGRLEIAPSGDLYVLSRKYHAVWILSPDGQQRGRIGGFGQGPGDLLMPYDMAFDHNGDLLVIERGNQRLQRFDRRGRSQERRPVQPNASSIAVTSDGSTLIASAKSGSRVLRIAPGGRAARPFLPLVDMPWIRPRVEAALPAGDQRDFFLDRLTTGYNESYVRLGRSGRIYDVSVWQPEVRVHDPDGTLVNTFSLDYSGLEDWYEKLDAVLAQLIAEGRPGVLILVQDFAIAPDDETLALALTGTCPGMILATPEGVVRQMLCLLDDLGDPFEPTAITSLGKGRWLVANETGVFAFTE